jgi:5-methylcytosine-specific restriction endonuclease McrA
MVSKNILISQASSRNNIITWKNPNVRQKRINGINLAFEKKHNIQKKELPNIIGGLVDKGFSVGQIVKKLNISSPTIRKYVNNEDKKQLIINNINIHKIAIKNIPYEKRIKGKYKNGQTGLYRKLRVEINQGKHSCIKCGSFKNVVIHHKEKLHYDKSYQSWKADNFRNNREDIEFLCASCHLKEHYNKYQRIRKGDTNVKSK